MHSPKRLARIAGVLYLFVAIFGGFAEAFVYPKIYVAGHAAATAANVVANGGLLRAGVVSDLLDQVFFLFVAMTLYVLLKHVHKGAARAMVVLVVLAAGITSLNTIFAFEASRVATGAVNLAAFGTAGSNAMVLLLLDAQHYGLLVAQVFFALWLAPLGYLAYRSGMFPKVLGILLVAACVSYLVDVAAAFLAPDAATAIHGYTAIMPAIAEPAMMLYLLIVGVKTAKPVTAARPVLAAA